MIVSEQLNYTKIWWFHAIFLPVIIEFSRCVGTYSSAKFELINKALMDFAAEPLAYDLCEMVGEEEIVEMSQVCEEIRKELYG
mgnify:CR=1 FL=1